MQNLDYTSRAIAAYYRAGKNTCPTAEECTVNGKRYVRLSTDGGTLTLAVYRIQNAGRLKGLKRWPKEIEG